MKNLNIFIFVLLIMIFLFIPGHAFAITDPFESFNNKFGIHILFPSEISLASEMVNGGNGNWGYVTIPIQVGDKDINKWQTFMNEAKNQHIIPIIRISTASDYFNKIAWYRPTNYDVLDFANFLNSLNWPTKNRYIVIFNETNRADEWGGLPNAGEYAKILDYAVDVFKEKSDDFFIISAGLDNASINKIGESVNEYDYLREMNSAVPGIFTKIDGFASHSYPNPGFRQPPYISTSRNIYSFKYEQELIYLLSGRRLPIFITETGWSSKELDDSTIGDYYNYAFNNVWNDNYIVAVTPFLLEANGDFTEFSFIKNGEKNKTFSIIKNIPKISGNPILSLTDKKSIIFQKTLLTSESNANPKINKDLKPNLKQFGNIMKWLLKI